MVDTIKWKPDDKGYLEIALFAAAGVNFRVEEDEYMSDVFLPREDVEELVHELRLWLAKTEAEKNINSDREFYQEGYKDGLKDSFNKLECEEFDTCLRIEYEKDKAYTQALDDFVDQFDIDESVIWSNAYECAKHLNIEETTDSIVDYAYNIVEKVAEQLKKGTEND